MSLTFCVQALHSKSFSQVRAREKRRTAGTWHFLQQTLPSFCCLLKTFYTIQAEILVPFCTRFQCSEVLGEVIPSSCSDLFFSRPRSEGWPHHGRTFSIYLCPLSFWLTLPWRVLSMSWCPSRPFVVFSIMSFSRQLPCFLMVWP